MHPIAPYARTAYAQGWAASGGPMTDRVKAGCVAAVEFACEHADDPGVIEATLRLGHLEGTWAAIYDRREALHREAENQALTLWRAAVKRLDLSAVIQQATAASPDTPPEQRRSALAVTVTAVLALLWTLPEWEQLRSYLTSAYGTARADGWAAAAALHSEQRGSGSPDLSDLTATAPDDNSIDGPSRVLSALSKIVLAAARTIARKLTRPTGPPPDQDEADTDAEEALDDGNDLALGVDTLIGGAYMAGLLAFLSFTGAQQLDFVTAGDGNVCPACQEAEDGSPYNITDVPAPPLHPRCRCVVTSGG